MYLAFDMRLRKIHEFKNLGNAWQGTKTMRLGLRLKTTKE